MTTSVDTSYLPKPSKQGIDISDLPVPSKQGIDIADLPVPPTSVSAAPKQADKPLKLEVSDAEAEKAAAKTFTLKPIDETAPTAPTRAGLGVGRKPLSGAAPTPVDTGFERKTGITVFGKKYLVEPKEQIPVNAIYDSNSEYFKKIRDYMESRGGESGKQGSKETDEEYMNRFFRHMRMVENNVILDLRSESAYLANTSVENAKKAGEALKIWEKVPSFYEEGGQKGIAPVVETVFSQISDPFTYFGYGASKGVVLGRIAMGRKVLQEIIENRIKQGATKTASKAVTAPAAAQQAAAIPKAVTYKPAAITGTAVQGVAGAAQEAALQQREIETGIRDVTADTAGNVIDIAPADSGNIITVQRDDGSSYRKFVPSSDELRVKVGQSVAENEPLNIPKIDKKSVAAMSVLSIAFSAPEIRQGSRVLTQNAAIKEYEQRLSGRKILSEQQQAQQAKEVKAIDDLFSDQDITKFDVLEGRNVLNKLSGPTELTEAQIKTEINKRALDVAKYLMKADPTLRPEPNQKISDFVKQLFMDIEEKGTGKIDDIVLEAALNRAGLTVSQFAQASRTTVHDAATIMQQASVLGKMFKRATALDDDAQKLFDAKMQLSSTEKGFGDVYNAVKSVDRNVRAVVVSGIGTTVRNVLGTSAALTMDAASKLLESSLYNTGRVIGLAATGKYQKGDIQKGLNNIVQDAFETTSFLTNVGLSSRVTDDILKYNPKFKDNFLSALQESGNEDITKFARFVNTLNVAQDAVFRKAVFNASVSKQLRDIGVDMLDAIATDKVIPKEILQRAADDALKMTFSYTPKIKSGNLEAGAETLGAYFVKTIEAAPILATGIVPFPRFVTNAIAWQYRNNVVSQPIVGTAQLARAASTAFKSGDMDKAEVLARDGLERVSKGVVGGAVLAWAYGSRSTSQDTKLTEIKTQEGDTVDLAGLSPLPAAALAVADVVYKFNNDEVFKINWKEVSKTLTGLESAGIRNVFFDNLPEMVQAAKDISEGGVGDKKEVRKFLKVAGQSFGDYFNMLLQPASPLIAFISSFDRQEQIARDPNVVEGEGAALFTDAMIKRVQNKIPVWRQSLPEATPYLRPDFVSPEAEQIVRPTQFFDALAGTKFTPQANVLEKEVTRIGMEPWEFFQPSGDRKMDRELIAKSRKHIRDIVMSRIQAPEYQQKPNIERRKAFRNYMAEAMGAAREELKGSVASADFNKYSKMQYENLSAMDRAGLKSYMNRIYKEKSPEITGDFSNAMNRYQEFNALSQ